MRKNLLATSALVALGVAGFAGSALAQSKPTISVSGYARQWFGYVSQDDFGKSATSPVDRSGFATAEDMEVHFNGRVQFDNGVVAGMRIELEGATSSDQIDESWMFLSGSFGRVQMGAFNHAAYLMSYFSPKSGVGLNEVEVYTFIQPPTTGDSWGLGGRLVTESARLSYDNDSNKIAYFTPRLYGFQLGASYAPQLQQDADGTGNKLDYHDSWSVAVNYDNKFENGLRLAGNIGYSQAAAPKTPVGLHSLPDIQGWNVGLNVKYMGFTFGGEYQRMMQGAYVTSKVSGGPGGATNQGFGQPSLRGHTYDVGLRYDFGAAGVGIQYLHGEAAGYEDVLHPGDVKTDAVVVGADYKLGPGTKLIGSFAWAKYQGDQLIEVNHEDSNKGIAVIGGIEIVF